MTSKEGDSMNKIFAGAAGMGNTAAVAIVICSIAAVILAFIIILLNHRRTGRIIDTLEYMVDKAVEGTFTETHFDETKLSALETKLAGYLSSSELAARNVAAEKDRIKELTSDISHQTKTPIANLLLYSEMLKEEDLPGEAHDYAETIYAQSDKMRFLIDSLVKLSRLEAGVFTLHPEKQKLQPLLKELETQYRPIAEGKGLTFVIIGMKANGKKNTKVLNELSDETSSEVSDANLDKNFPSQHAEYSTEKPNGAEHAEAVFDKKWTAEAVGNVIDNAIKYTECGGITISMKAYTMFTCISVCDTGIGISEDEKARIFGRFYRSEKVRNVEGVGIGLYLTREILSREGGYIKVSSGEPASDKTGSVDTVKADTGETKKIRENNSDETNETALKYQAGSRFDIFLPNA